MKKLVLPALFAVAAFSLSTAALAAPSLDEVLTNLQNNQGKIKDLYAETVTKITSNLQLTTRNQTKTMEQKGKIWSKGDKLSKIEIDSPMKQITITNGDKMMITNPETGQKMIQDLKKLRQQSGGDNSGQMNLAKAKEMFDLSLAEKDSNYIVSGVPKQANQFLGKLEFYIDPSRWVPTKIIMYDPKGKQVSQSELTYQQVNGLTVPAAVKSAISSPAGAMKVEMSYQNVKVNQGLSDSVFKIE